MSDVKKGDIVNRTVDDHGYDEEKQYTVLGVADGWAHLKRANRQGIIYETSAKVEELTVVGSVD